jgi:hypothetical protein
MVLLGRRTLLAAAAAAAAAATTFTLVAATSGGGWGGLSLEDGKIYYASDVPALRLSRPPAKAGTLDCRSRRTIPTWNNEEVPVCDASLCSAGGGGPLKPLILANETGEVDGLTPRFSDTQLTRYMKALGVADLIDGWMSHVHTWAVNFLTLHQHRSGIFGSVGEFGVWKGKLFLGMAGFAHPDEPLLAADWFTDATEEGYLKGFVANVRTYLGGAGLARTLIYQGNTASLSPKWFADHRLPLFRMISVDAGHSQEAVLRDLNLAGCLIADGGVVIVDDFGFHVDSDWMGVNTAVYHFVLEQTRLVPFLYADNKLYLTTATHAEEYYNLLAAEEGVRCFPKDAHAGQFSLGNYKTCLFTSNFAYDCADAFLMRHRADFARAGVVLRPGDEEGEAGGSGGGGGAGGGRDEL